MNDTTLDPIAHRSVFMKIATRTFEYRHPDIWIRAKIALAGWAVIVAAWLCALGYLWGLVFLVFAPERIYVAVRMQDIVRRSAEYRALHGMS
jgi:hypothetical protein